MANFYTVTGLTVTPTKPSFNTDEDVNIRVQGTSHRQGGPTTEWHTIISAYDAVGRLIKSIDQFWRGFPVSFDQDFDVTIDVGRFPAGSVQGSVAVSHHG